MNRLFQLILSALDFVIRLHTFFVYHISPEKGRKGKSYIEYQTAKTGTNWKGKLKETVNLLIPQVTDFEELLHKLQASGYEIKRGKYVSCRAPGQERFTRLKTLGAE